MFAIFSLGLFLLGVLQVSLLFTLFTLKVCVPLRATHIFVFTYTYFTLKADLIPMNDQQVSRLKRINTFYFGGDM